MNKPLCYDVFCKAGGATKGYQDAGFYVVGIDKDPQPNYCGNEFIQMDALAFLEKLFKGDYPEPVLISASPPCQVYSVTKSLTTKEHPDLIEPTRAALLATSKPYIIENVPGAPLKNPIMLCGTMFGLQVIRHRLFETSLPIWWPPTQCQHIGKSSSSGRGISRKNLKGYHRATLDNFEYITVAGHDFILKDALIAMGIDWMNQAQIAQAIPPAYTKWLGGVMLELIAETNPATGAEEA